MTYTIEQLIQKCIEQDAKAQAFLYKKYYNNLLKISKRYLKNIEDAEDAVIQTLTIVLTKILSYKGDCTNEKLYCFIHFSFELVLSQRSTTIFSFDEQRAQK